MNPVELALELDKQGWWFCPFDPGPWLDSIVDSTISYADHFSKPGACLSEAGYQYSDGERRSLWHMVENQRQHFAEAVGRRKRFQRSIPE